MSKTKTIGSPHFEMLFIISNKYSENELPPILEKISQIIEEKRGNITYSEVWGKKKMAYPIKGMAYGYYFLHEFDMDGKNVNELDRLLRMSNDIIRHQIVRVSVRAIDKPKKEEIRAERTVFTEEVQAVSEIKETAIEIAAKTKHDEDSATKPAKEKATEGKTKESKKVDLKDLDEKLDKILDVDSLL